LRRQLFADRERGLSKDTTRIGARISLNGHAQLESRPKLKANCNEIQNKNILVVG
jgi:hypothetical protein